MTCPVCGTVTVPGARFCHSCGHALPVVAGLPAAERRVVTVLFGDLSDFTAWSEEVDPERVGAVTDRVLAALAGAVKTFGGHVDKLTGDGIMAVFGAPVAHEDDPERAVRAALAMQRAVRRVLDDERGGGAPSGLRIGVNTGDVVAGVQAAIEYTVIGDTVNTAARLADAADVGTIYAGAATTAATRHLASWRRLLPLRLKGKRQAVEAYELLGLLDAPGTRSGLGDEAPFVGREAEMALVDNRLAEVIDQGQPRVLVFTADAGVGKTRLAAEIARAAYGATATGYDGGTSGGARVLAVRCAAYGERWRSGPLVDLVRVAIGLPEPATRAAAEERLRRVREILRRRTGSPPALRTGQLLALLGFADDAGAGQDVSEPERTELARGENMVASATSAVQRGNAGDESAPAAVAELLSALAQDAPLVVIVDDLHDAIPATIDALGAMLNRLTGPVLVVLLGRPELVRAAGALTRLADAEVRPVPPLRGAEMSRLLTAYLRGGRLPAADQDRLLATAQGNPFYLAELVTLLIERGALRQVGEPSTEAGPGTATVPRWDLREGSLSGRLLSRDLAAVLAARIDALPVPARAVLRDAAVVGDVVPAAALAAVRSAVAPTSETGAGGDADLEGALDELLHRRMLLPVRNGYSFATPLLREAAYAGVGKADLADRHAELARWAAGLRPPADGVAPSLGWTADVVDVFIADHAEQAAALADEVSLRPDAPARAVAPLGVSALSRLAHRAIRSGEPGQAADFAARARALSHGDLPVADRLVYASALVQLGQRDRALAEIEAIREVAEPAAAARALLLAGRVHHQAGDGERGDEAWAQALAVATAADLATERAEALRRIGMSDYRRGRLGQAQAGFREALEIAQAAGDRRGEAWALQNLAWVATTLGDFPAADAELSRAARLFAELGSTTGRAWLRGSTAFNRLLAGRLHEARRLARAFLPFGERVGERWAAATLRAVAAFAGAELGDLDEADQEARQAFGEFDESDDDWGRAFALVVRAVVAWERRDAPRALELSGEACRYAVRTGHPLLLGIAHTLLGFAALDAGDAATAQAEAATVLAVNGEHGVADPVRVAPLTLLGSAYLAQGDAARALEVLAEAAAVQGGSVVLVPHRLVVATQARALLAAQRVDEALATARRAVNLPGEDVRSREVAERVLADALAAAGTAVPV